MTFTIEPMVNAGKRHVRLLPDGWTVITKDHSLSAQWEHTVLVTETGVDVLTLGAAGAAALRSPQHHGCRGDRAAASSRLCDAAGVAAARAPARRSWRP